VIVLTRICGHPTKGGGGPPAWRLGDLLPTPHCKNLRCYVTFHKDSAGYCKCGNEHSGSHKIRGIS
jgi:hypothetical protein